MPKKTKTEEFDDRHLAALAAQILVEEGWCQGRLWGPRGMCAMGAVHAARSRSGHEWAGFRIYDDLRASLGMSLVDFNDREERKMEDVVGVLQEYAGGER